MENGDFVLEDLALRDAFQRHIWRNHTSETADLETAQEHAKRIQEQGFWE